MAQKGRPRLKIDWSKVDTALALGANINQVAAFCECSITAIQNAIQKEKSLTFMEYRERKMSGTNLKVTQRLLQLAMSGNLGAIIWWQKNLLGWSDRVEHGFDKDKRTIILKYGLDAKDEPKADNE